LIVTYAYADRWLDQVKSDGLAGEPDSVAYRLHAIQENAGAAASGRAVTDTLYVSPNGTNTDGKSWTTAYTTIQGALDAASTDANELTLILIGINTGSDYYDIATASDPTWTGNYILKGSHRTWVKIKNDTGDSILKFTGYVSLIDLNFNLGTDNNGVIITKGAFRVSHCQFVGEDLDGAITRTALHIDGASLLKHGQVSDTHFLGDGTTRLTAIKLDHVARSEFSHVEIHECKTGIQITETDSDSNYFYNVDIGDSATGLDLDAGNEQHFESISFHHNTANVDDATVGQSDHHYNNISGEFKIAAYPEDVDGTPVAGHANADEFGTDTELRAAVTATKPFKIVGYAFKLAVTQEHLIGFSTDSGSTYFNQMIVGSTKGQATAATADTDFIFNPGTRISARVMAESDGGDIVYIWLKIQEI